MSNPSNWGEFMPEEPRHGGSIPDRSRQELMAGAQASAEAQAAQARRELDQRDEAVRQVATEVIQQILGPDLDLEPEDWDVVSAYWSSDGGYQDRPVANTQIEGISVVVIFAGSVTARSAYARIGGPVGYEEISVGYGTPLTRDSFGWALRHQEPR